jgi:hypothetical protein
MGLDSIEFLFVAYSAIDYRFIEPLAPFYSRMSAD